SRVSIWKLNNLEKPVYTFTEQHDVCQIKWSPLKEAWLGVLVNDSSTIKLYYTYPMFLQPLEESEQIPLEHTVFPSGRSTVPLVSFSWHPVVPDCLLTLDRDGCLDVAQIIKRAAIVSFSTLGRRLASFMNPFIWFYGPFSEYLVYKVCTLTVNILH
ncbi:hypothetical protein PHET_08243, partial [Paragonimus heterotremus]